jgi:hypothetical protein
MKKNIVLWMSVLLLSMTAGLSSCSSDDDEEPVCDKSGLAIYVVARQDADALNQYETEMPLFWLYSIESFNTETGELKLADFKFDTHLFHDIDCKYRVYFYHGDDLLFDARAVSWLSSASYSDLTFQCDVYGPGDLWETSKSHFYLRYGYPGTIEGDPAIEALKQKNAAGMERFVSILRNAGKIVNN